MQEFVVLLGEDSMPHFMKRGRKFGLTSASIDINDFKTSAIDNDLTSVSANHHTIASAKTIKEYIHII